MKTKSILLIAGSLCCAPLSHAANIIDSIYGIGAGSCEIPDPNITNYQTFTAGSTAMTGWTVGQASIDRVHQNIWTSSDGKYSLDMNGTDFTGPDAPEVGSVYTVIPTTAGSTYLVSFDVCGYLNFGNSTNPKEMDVSVEAVNMSSCSPKSIARTSSSPPPTTAASLPSCSIGPRAPSPSSPPKRTPASLSFPRSPTTAQA